ncbi:MAG: hypothetical protein AB7O65_12570 [Candidatus Korobacteraceae bacterium]
MNVLTGLAIFLLGASAGSVLRYFQDRKLIQLYREEAQQALQALQEVVNAGETSPASPAKKPAAAAPGESHAAGAGSTLLSA